MEHVSSPFIPLLLIMLLAVAVPFLVNRIRFVRIPIVVGEILAGIIIGQSGFDLVHPTPILNFLSEFGFAFLMFLSGLEVDPNTMVGSSTKKSGSGWKSPVPLSLIYFACTIILGMGFGYGLSIFDLVKNPILMGLILSTTSLGIVVPILKERGLTTTIYGQAVLIAALVSDFATLLLLSVVIAVLSQGFKLELLLFMVLFVVFIFSVKISNSLKKIPGMGLLVKELSHATAQIRVRGAFALLVTFVVLAEFLGVELILGAFLGGVLVSISSEGSESPLHGKLDAIGYGFFIPIFFINVGAQFDLGALLSSSAALLLVPVIIGAAYLVKLIPALFYRTIFSWRETLALGTLMSSRLSLIIAASAIALNLGLIPT
ncbi:MAG: cation:proton antiporter, partial [Pyrinomonadaceae bacterium]